MGALFSKKNKEVFSTPLGLNNPVTVQVLGDYGILQRSDFIAAQDYSQPHPYHRSVGSSCGVGNYCK